jgi:hypothetical protein
MQGMVNTRSMARGEVDIRVKNKAKVFVMDAWTMQHRLPSGFNMELSTCYYVHVSSQDVVSASCLMRQVYESNIKNNDCPLLLNKMFHGYVHVHDGLIILNHDDEEIYNININRLNINVPNMTYFWQYFIGHLNLKHMKKLHGDELLDLYDLKIFETCGSCLPNK